ncbi:TetR/AcrR family transcriptional regulator [Butyricicoccus sp.]|uniref:TetR/AcrR family transcriptional regulator n=1 Tax=Butyricicoccus sp. TaxID=2049021 RepID=UPI003F17D203
MKNSHLDRRSQYSQKMLRKALLELMQTKKLSAITVTDICKLADLNRGTFYKYYDDVNDLFSHIEAAFIEELRSLMEQNDPTSSEGIETVFRQSIRILKENDDFVRIAQTPESAEHIIKSLLSSFDPQLLRFAKNRYPDVTEAEATYIIEYMIGGCVKIISHWIRDDQAMPSEQLIALLVRLLTTS